MAILIAQFFLRYLSEGLVMMMLLELPVGRAEDSLATVLGQWKQPLAELLVEPWVKEL